MKTLLFCFTWSHSMWAERNAAIKGLVGRRSLHRTPYAVCIRHDKDLRSSFVFLFSSEMISTQIHFGDPTYSNKNRKKEIVFSSNGERKDVKRCEEVKRCGPFLNQVSARVLGCLG